MQTPCPSGLVLVSEMGGFVFVQFTEHLGWKEERSVRSLQHDWSALLSLLRSFISLVRTGPAPGIAFPPRAPEPIEVSGT